MQVVSEENIGALLVEYLEHRGGRERLVDAAVDILHHITAGVDSENAARELTPYIIQALRSLPLEDSLAQLLSVLAEHPHADRVFNVFVRMGRRIIRTDAFQELLHENVASMRAEYEGDGMIRAFVLSFFDDAMIVEGLTDYLDEMLESALEAEHWRHIDGVAALGAFVTAVRSDPALRDILYQYKIHLAEHIDIASMIVDFIETRVRGARPFWVPYLKQLLNEKLDTFVHSAAWQSRADRFVKGVIAAEIDKHHDLVAVFVREYLSKKSDDELIAFIERKVRGDLQMIRVNGAVVGAIVGMGLSLCVTLAERMWGL